MNTRICRGYPRLLLSIVLLAAASLAQAANITWGAPQQITGDTDVSTNGTLLQAYNLGDTGVLPVTLNGVTFQSFAVPNGGTFGTTGNATMTGTAAFFSSNVSNGYPLAPFTALSPNYQTLLRSAANQFTGTFTLAMSGLVPGLQYAFQWWWNFSAAVPGGSTTATAGSSVTLVGNTGDAEGGLGQWAIGTFTADAATQSIVFTGAPGIRGLNAFQLRQLSSGPAAVPEPGGTFTLVALALGATLLTTNTLPFFSRRKISSQ